MVVVVELALEAVQHVDHVLEPVLLQLRAAWTHGGGTWAIPGGALDSHEDPITAAVREGYRTPAGSEPLIMIERASEGASILSSAQTGSA